MVYSRKRLSKAIVNDRNVRIVRHGLKVIRASDSQDPGDGEDLKDQAMAYRRRHGH